MNRIGNREQGTGNREAIAIVGPTASGKTALSLEVARRLDAEIISMDSRQVYRGMDIGTAKATAAERAGVPHHGLDLVHPEHRFGAGRFAREARCWIREIGGRGRVPLLVGGTGFFLRALTHPIFRQPELDPLRRAELQRVLEGFETAELHRWLAALDPDAAVRLSAWGGRQRLLRALELPLLTGRSLSWWHRHAPPEDEPLRPLVFVLDLPREQLFARIDSRVEHLVAAGLLEEVRALMQAGYDEHSPGMRAHGYQEVVPHLRGEIPLEQAPAAVKRATRAYARRQLTWFRNQLPGGAIWLDGTLPASALADVVAERWRAATED